MNFANNAFRLFTRFILISALLSLCSHVLLAQDATGRIVGTISDSSGAVVPGVHVVVTNTATRVSRETATDSNGYYQVLSLSIGSYTVSADHMPQGVDVPFGRVFPGQIHCQDAPLLR